MLYIKYNQSVGCHNMEQQVQFKKEKKMSRVKQELYLVPGETMSPR
jgi:hypothetical protein